MIEDNQSRQDTVAAYAHAVDLWTGEDVNEAKDLWTDDDEITEEIEVIQEPATGGIQIRTRIRNLIPQKVRAEIKMVKDLTLYYPEVLPLHLEA